MPHVETEDLVTRANFRRAASTEFSVPARGACIAQRLNFILHKAGDVIAKAITHVIIQQALGRKAVEWTEKVSDEQYQK